MTYIAILTHHGSVTDRQTHRQMDHEQTDVLHKNYALQSAKLRMQMRHKNSRTSLSDRKAAVTYQGQKANGSHGCVFSAQTTMAG